MKYILLVFILGMSACASRPVCNSNDVQQGLQQIKNTIREVVVDSYNIQAQSHLHGQNEDNRELTKNNVIVLSGTLNAKSAESVISKLLLFDKQRAKEISLYLNMNEHSDLSDIFSVVSVMELIKVKVNTYVLGFCNYECAMIVLASSGRRVGSSHSYYQFFVPYVTGNDVTNNAGLIFYKYFLKKSPLLKTSFLDRKENWINLSVNEALSLGLISEISP